MICKYKKLIKVITFVLLVCALNSFLNFALIQPGLARTMFYEAKKQDYECLVLGASHGSYGIDSYTLEEELGMPVMNMCMGGEYIYDAYHVLRYALSKKRDIRMVILDIDYQYFMNQHDESILFNTVYNAYPNEATKFSYFSEKMLKEEYRGTFLPWTNYWQCYRYIGKTIAKKTSAEYRHYSSSVVEMNANDTYMGRGFIYRNRNEKKSDVSCLDWDDSKLDTEQETYISRIVELCRENDIQIVFTTVAQDPDTVCEKIESFTKADNYIRGIANELGVGYYNFNKMYQAYFERSSSDFYDKEGHMYGDVAERFTAVYGQVIREALSTGLQNNYFATDFGEML